MIEFEFESRNDKTFTFADVEEDQFFINRSGYLCQKQNVCAYITIADEEGIPYCSDSNCEVDEIVQKILPKVTKIKFE